MMTFYAVIDTNVLVSALLSSHEDAATVRVVSMLFSNKIVPLFNNKILSEYRDVLHRPKFKFSKAVVDNMLVAIERLGICITTTGIDITLPDIKDQPFYEVVINSQIDNAYLVTGNIRHFPEKPYIVTPKQMLDIITDSNRIQE